jgi:hypothetical protein
MIPQNKSSLSSAGFPFFSITRDFGKNGIVAWPGSRSADGAAAERSRAGKFSRGGSLTCSWRLQSHEIYTTLSDADLSRAERAQEHRWHYRFLI